MATSTAQTRSARAAGTTAWPPPSSGLMMHSRPWRSSPLAGPAFSTLPPVILETSEEYYEDDDLSGPDSAHCLPRTRPPSSSSIASQTGSLSASGYGSRNASGSASALLLAEGDASTSSVSLSASTGANGSLSNHLSKSQWGRRTDDAASSPKNASDAPGSIAPPPRARTLSHGHSRSASLPVPPIAPSPTIPQAYSRASPCPSSSESDANNAKQPPSKSRDPASNWMSSSPFGPAQTPKFSRLAMASPAVVMPLSAKEYRKQKARESMGKGKDQESPTSPQGPSGVPVVTISPPPPEGVRRPSSPGDRSPDRRGQPQPSMSPRPSSPKQKRPRSRPNTPPRSSPLASHPPISPKSSAGTFFSFVSSDDDDATRPQGADIPSDDSNPIPPARPRPRPRRRKSYPERLSNGARLSLLEAMNRLSQESAASHRLSGHSQTDAVNRLSMASQASGHTLFYDIESEDKAQLTDGSGNGNRKPDGGAQRTPVLHTQSLEDLSSTLARTGIEVVPPDGDGHIDDSLDDERSRGKRNVRMVRISDTVEVSPSPVHRRRKLTKSRPVSTRMTVLGVGLGTIDEVKEHTQAQVQDRRVSLLPWKSKGSGDAKGNASGAASGPVVAIEKAMSTPTKALETPVLSPFPIADGSTSVESRPKPKSNGPTKKSSSDKPLRRPTTAPSPEPESTPAAPHRKSRRYTFSLLPSSTFGRPRREKSNTAPPSVDLGLDQHKDKRQGSTGTDSTSTSIRTITQGSQTTLVPSSPVYDLTTATSSGRNSGSSVPMLRRLTAQELTTGGVPSPTERDDKRDSTPSLITNGSTGTTLSSPRTPSYTRATGAEPFVHRPSALKESFGDVSEDDSEGRLGVARTSRMCVHRRLEQSPSARAGAGWGETSEDDERYLRPGTSPPRPGSRPGTASSTATETSGSYASFSTVPASTSSSSSASRSESPSPILGEKQDPMMSAVQSGYVDEDVHECVLCGHRSSPSPPPAFTPSPAHEPNLEGIHPMFTVPLVTIPASALGLYARPTSNMPFMMQGGRDMGTGRRMGEWHTVVPVPVGVDVSVPPMGPDQNWSHMHVNASGGPLTAKTMTMAMNDQMMSSLSPLPPPPVLTPPRVKKRLRPQTAPPGTGDAALKFIEDTKAMHARQAGIDIDVLVGGDRLTKNKTTSGESKFKAVLKGLLRWTG